MGELVQRETRGDKLFPKRDDDRELHSPNKREDRSITPPQKRDNGKTLND